jgi:hypothetical protein
MSHYSSHALLATNRQSGFCFPSSFSFLLIFFVVLMLVNNKGEAQVVIRERVAIQSAGGLPPNTLFGQWVNL